MGIYTQPQWESPETELTTVVAEEMRINFLGGQALVLILDERICRKRESVLQDNGIDREICRFVPQARLPCPSSTVVR